METFVLSSCTCLETKILVFSLSMKWKRFPDRKNMPTTSEAGAWVSYRCIHSRSYHQRGLGLGVLQVYTVDHTTSEAGTWVSCRSTQ